MAEKGFTLTQAIAYFEDAEELSFDSRTSAERCRDYYDHKQWTTQEKAALNKRCQPIITRNRIKPKVDFLKGMETQTRTDPKAFPRNPGDDDAATAATDAIRFVCDQTKFINTKSDCFENLTIEGVCGVEVYAKPGRGKDIDICIRRFAWDRLFWDQHSREKDFSDTRYRGGVIWMDFEEAVERYPSKREALVSTLAQEGTISSTYDDTPRLRWADDKRKRVRVVKLEFKRGDEVYTCEFTKGGFLVDPSPSTYVDENGVPEWSILLQSAHVDREGNRYGWVQAWLDTQDEINKRASKGLHLASVRQTFGTRGAVADVNKAKRELAKPDGHLEVEMGEFGKDFGILPTGDMAAAQFSMLQEAKQEIDSVGVNAALAGSDQRGLSGKAIGRLQQGGSTEIKPLLDCLASFNNQVYRTVWNRIKQFWTAEKWIRVTDDENNLKWVGLNQPVTVRQQLMEEMGEIPPEFEGDPRLDQVIQVKNEVAKIDVDIIIEEVPDTVNVQQEQFDALTSIFPAIPDEQKPAMLEMLIESSTVRNKSKFLERLKGGGEGQDPAAAQAAQQQMQQQQDMQQQMFELEKRLKEAEISKTETASILNLAKAETAEIGQNLAAYKMILDDFTRTQGEMPGQPMTPNQPPQMQQPTGQESMTAGTPSGMGEMIPEPQIMDQRAMLAGQVPE